MCTRDPEKHRIFVTSFMADELFLTNNEEEKYRKGKNFPNLFNRHIPKNMEQSNKDARRIRVAVRMRPPLEEEVLADGVKWRPAVSVVASRDGAVVRLEGGGERCREFAFDYAFPATSSQVDVFEQVAAPVIDEVLERGANGTIMAYGQTGTGKTFTLGLLERLGERCVESSGIVPRALERIFSGAGSPTNSRVTMSFLHIYRENIHDLLAPPQATERFKSFQVTSTGTSRPGGAEALAVRENPGNGFYVEGLREYLVTDLGEAEALVNYGLENRAIAPTLMNATSSRSHTVLTVTVEVNSSSSSRPSSPRDDDERSSDERTCAWSSTKLMFIDLAGSERVRRTSSRGTRLAEARAINSSLAALGNVIAALSEESTRQRHHVPFRDSKLTKLLQDSLLGPARTALIATLGPARCSLTETLSTLAFASRCSQVRLSSSATNDERRGIMCAAEYARMRRRLAALEADFADREQQQKSKFQANLTRRQPSLPRAELSLEQTSLRCDESSVVNDMVPRAHDALAYAEALLDAAAAGANFAIAAASAADVRARASYTKPEPASIQRMIEFLTDVLPAKLRQTLDDRDAHECRLKQEVESWSLVLEHLVAVNSNLKAQLKHASKLHPDARVKPVAWHDDKPREMAPHGNQPVDPCSPQSGVFTPVTASRNACNVSAIPSGRISPHFSQLDEVDPVPKQDPQASCLLNDLFSPKDPNSSPK